MRYENHKYKLLFTSALFLLLGIAFIVYPAHSMIMLVRITGGFLILLGILIFIPSFREKDMLGFRFGLLVALTIIIAVFGVILLVMPEAFVEVFWITLGIILILDGLKNLIYLTAIPFRLINVILSVISVICGVLILLHPFGTGLAYIVLIGAFFAYSGAAGLALSIISKIKGVPVETGTAAEAGDVYDETEAGAEEADEPVDEAEEPAEDAEPEDEEDPYERDSELKPKK